MSKIIILTDLGCSRPNNRYIGPYVIANHLENNGYDTVVIDYFIRHPNIFEYLEAFLEDDTVAVLISTTFLTHIPDNKRKSHRYDHTYGSRDLWCTSNDELSQWFETLRLTIDKYSPNAKIILGGGKVPWIYEKHLNQNYVNHSYGLVDYMVMGVADESIVSLINYITKKSNKKNILITKKHGLNFVIGRNSYEKCPPMRFKSKWALMKNEGLPIEVARGCLYNCKFCHHDKKASYRKSLTDLRDELIFNYENYGTTNYHFCDDCFNDTKPKVMETCEMFLKLRFKINWVSYARVDLAVKFPETLDIMMESGARGLSFGIETFNYEAGRKAGKGCPPWKVKEMLLETRKKYKGQCLYAGTFITGLPGETIETQMETINWLINNDALDFALFGGLGITEYDDELDGDVKDYSDYGRNPEKYGFLEIKFRPLYWRHETMDRPKALELGKTCTTMWHNSGHMPFLETIWSVPLLMGFGYNWNDIISMARDESKRDYWRQVVNEKMIDYRVEYWKKLKQLNQKENL